MGVLGVFKNLAGDLSHSRSVTLPIRSSLFILLVFKLRLFLSCVRFICSLSSGFCATESDDE